MLKFLKGIWDKVKKDFEERFLSFETFKGIYLFPCGIATIYISVYYQQYVIQGLGIMFGIYLLLEGARKITVNRIKQRQKRIKLYDARCERCTH